MPLPSFIRNSKAMRQPLLAACSLLVRALTSGPALLRRATYDAMPVPYLVTGHPELFVVSTSDKVIGRELFLHGEFDFEKLLRALSILAAQGCARPRHLIDVGANIGTIVIPALKRGLFESATAIEPHPANLRLLRANLALNEVEERVTVLGIAVGDQSGLTLQLEESADNSGNHQIGAHGIPVSSARLDDLDISSANALLWMDIEGYEGHALKGADKLLGTGMPIVCEFNPYFLRRSGGLALFQEALAKYQLFDLKSERCEEVTLDELAGRYAEDREFTDLLAIPFNRY